MGEISWSQKGAIRTLVFDDPKSNNAMSPAMEDQLHELLHEADNDPSVRVIILTGAGRSFCAGYSFGVNREATEDTAAARLRTWYSIDMRKAERFMHTMEMSKPVIAAVNGWCMGGGFAYALACDVTIAADTAVFGQPEVRRISAATVLFAALSGWKVAHRYGLTGDHFDAQEAYRIGVVNEVVPADKLLERAHELAERLALVPADSLRINKAITTYGLETMGLRNALNMMGALATVVHTSNDDPSVAEMYKARRGGDPRGFIELRDTPFLPEPGGPKSRPRTKKT